MASCLCPFRASTGINPHFPSVKEWDARKRGPGLRKLKTPRRESEKRQTGGGVGIRTLDALVGHTHLAGEHLRPLGHSSA